MRTKTYKRTATAALLAVAALGTSHCASRSPRPAEAAAWAPPARLGATTDAGADTLNFTARGRVFFGLHPTYNPATAVEELLVAIRPDGTPYIRLGREEIEGAAIIDPDRIVAHRRASTLELRVYPDGSFDGVERYEDGSASTYERTTYRPLEKALFDAHGAGAPFAGFVGGDARYRMKLALKDDGSVEGVARYVMTSEELLLRGKVDRQRRRIEVDELGPGSTVTGRLDLLVLGHVLGPGFSGPFAIVGTWTSPDGKRQKPVRLDAGYYPTRTRAGNAAWLSAQESYEDDCGVIHDYVWPLVDGAPAGVAATLERKLKTLALQSIAPDSIDPSEIAKLVPRSRVKDKNECNPDASVETRGMESGVFTATPLRGARVAVDVEHYYQSGGISGHVWHDCIVLDLAKGTILEPAKLLDSTTRKTLEKRARAAAIAAVGDAKPDDPMLAAARAIDLEHVPLCIEETKVRFAYVGHRVFGPAAPEFDRNEVEKMLPNGELRDLLAK